jgi:hypothetical protein
MKVFNLVVVAASFLCSGGTGWSQNLLTPGETASTTTMARSPFDAGFEGSPLTSKTSIASVAGERGSRMRTVWIVSIGTMLGATAADAYSSWGKRESNSLLASANGTFGGKGVAIKAGLAGCVLTPQFLFRKHSDWHLAFAVSNFAETGIFTGAAIHNMQIK